MNYPAFHPGMGEGIDPILRFLLRPDQAEAAAALVLKGFARRPEGVEVFLESAADPSGTARWRVLVSDCLAFGFLEEPISTARVLREHPVLWRHRLPEMELSVAGSVRDPAAAAAALRRAHARLVEAASQGIGVPWVLLEHFAGTRQRVEELLAAGGGRIARVPEHLMRGYAKALDRAGASTSILSMPGRWAKAKSGQKLPMALFLGVSFAVGTSLQCRQV